MKIIDVINEFVSYSFNHNLIKESDTIYLFNKIMGILKIEYREGEIVLLKDTRIIDEILDDIIDYAVTNKIIGDYLYERDLFDTLIMDTVTPLPSQVISEFFDRFKTSPKSATDYFFKLMNDVNYIRSNRIKKNISFTKSSLIKAYIDVSAMGFYDVKINGKSITNTIFNPGWTSVTKRVQYQRYNILDLLKEENEMEILLGEGWGGAERLGWDGPDRPFFSPSLIFEVTLIDDDGMKEYISSDDSIDVYSSYIVKSSIYDGEKL